MVRSLRFFVGLALLGMGLVLLEWALDFVLAAESFVLDTDDLLLPSVVAWAVTLGLPLLGAWMMYSGQAGGPARPPVYSPQ